MLAAGLLALAIFALSGCGARDESHARATVRASYASATPPDRAASLPRHALRLIVGSPLNVHPIPSGFLGLSIEYPSIEAYAGSDPSGINPLFVRLVRNLAPGQRPVIRIGGDSTDWMWWPVPHMRKPGGVRYTLTPGWIAVTKALAQQLDAKLILGVDLEANSLTLERTEANAFINGLGAPSIEALEPGNEPELYGSWPWYLHDHVPVRGRPSSWSIADYEREVVTLRRALDDAPIAGPATGGPKWTTELPQFIGASPYLKLVTVHSYPLQLCYITPSDPRYPTIGHLLSPQASRGLAARVAPYVRFAHAHGKPLRIGEMNTNSCGSAPRVTKSFASALWAIDALFAMASVGVDGVNIHTYNGSSYELFSFTRAHGQWTQHVFPEYYGLELFAQGAPPGSRLLRTSGPAAHALRSWATEGTDGRVRITLINDDLSHARTVAIAAGSDDGARATLTRLGGTETELAPTHGYYLVRLAPGSAALLVS